ncbi:hypothetical protein E1J38_009010 [Seonamhaeicola sediminis]|uniref:Uncharacterized protein n=1 Tax=Seonamhaeicola sediminis TaxID=2528206 RepID=A0A562YEI4_9FLAO|nr:hypothetical protein [Seonamhaeicola sediminis]TWO32990.1 hypothetical protein E1J38_009010 [Seonamhaeicola sediminis]
MGLELVIFIAAILFGIFIYWRESQANKLYRFFNKIFNSKELQMKPENKKGFVFKQAFLPRLVYVVGFFLVTGLIIQFLSPFEIFTSYNGISAFASISVGTLIGTYLANFVLKSGKVIEEKSDSLGEVVNATIEKGKDIIEDIKTKDFKEEPEEDLQKEPKKQGKSARERLKDKGYLK